MAYWDYVLGFHEKAHERNPSGKAGLEAIRSIRDILDPDLQPDARHPLRSKLMLSSEENYRWLIHFSQKLKELKQIHGSERVLARFGHSDEYLGALAEMDFGLKVRLSGYPCKFSFERGKPSPDIVAEIAAQETDIEITSLNPPYDDVAWTSAIDSVTMTAINAHCRAGGMWARVPAPKELEEVKGKASQAVAKANAERKMVELNIPGLLNCYIEPEDLDSQIPVPWRGSFVMRTQSPRPKKDRLAMKIGEKAKSQLSSSKPSVLVIYDRFSSPDESQRFFDEKEIELVVGTFGNLAGVILVFPFNAWDSPPTKRVNKNGRSYVEYSLPDREVESCVIWGNPMADHHSLLEPIIKCLTDFPDNLTKLFAAEAL
jgi:hypothetical protein